MPWMVSCWNAPGRLNPAAHSVSTIDTTGGWSRMQPEPSHRGPRSDRKDKEKNRGMTPNRKGGKNKGRRRSVERGRGGRRVSDGVRVQKNCLLARKTPDGQPKLGRGAGTEKTVKETHDLGPDVLEETHNVAEKAFHFFNLLCLTETLAFSCRGTLGRFIQQYRPPFGMLQSPPTAAFQDMRDIIRLGMPITTNKPRAFPSRPSRGTCPAKASWRRWMARRAGGR